MAKKRRDKKKDKRAVDDAASGDEDAKSEKSYDSAPSFARSIDRGEADVDYPAEVDAETKLDEYIEQLSERRGSTRVEGLEKLTEKLLQCLTLETISARRETLLSNLLNCLRKPSEAEGLLAPRLLAIIGVTIGPDEETFYLDVQAALKNLVKNSKHGEVRAECLNALTLICFICTTDETYAIETMKLCENYFSTRCPTELCLSALNGWGLLASVQPESFLAETAFPQWHTIFVSLLDHTDLEIRIAAGENIALLFEAIHATGTIVHEKNTIAERLFNLSKESCKRTSKKDRKEQRSTFRDIYATVEGDTSPVLNMTIQNEPMQFESWGIIKQINAVKDCLRTGFQEHIQFNAALRPIFDLPLLTGDERLEIIQEKRVKLSKTSDRSKQRDASLKDSRRRRQNQKNLFLQED